MATEQFDLFAYLVDGRTSYIHLLFGIILVTPLKEEHISISIGSFIQIYASFIFYFVRFHCVSLMCVVTYNCVQLGMGSLVFENLLVLAETLFSIMQ